MCTGFKILQNSNAAPAFVRPANARVRAQVILIWVCKYGCASPTRLRMLSKRKNVGVVARGLNEARKVDRRSKTTKLCFVFSGRVARDIKARNSHGPHGVVEKRAVWKHWNTIYCGPLETLFATTEHVITAVPKTGSQELLTRPPANQI